MVRTTTMSALLAGCAPVKKVATQQTTKLKSVCVCSCGMRIRTGYLLSGKTSFSTKLKCPHVALTKATASIVTTLPVPGSFVTSKFTVRGPNVYDATHIPQPVSMAEKSCKFV